MRLCVGVSDLSRALDIDTLRDNLSRARNADTLTVNVIRILTNLLTNLSFQSLLDEKITSKFVTSTFNFSTHQCQALSRKFNWQLTVNKFTVRNRRSNRIS